MMLKKISRSVSIDKIDNFCRSDFIENLLNISINDKTKTEINQPTGDFFYDPWEIKTEFKNTVIEEIVNTLPSPIGEARLILLKPGSCYHSHADIDDRYHLNIQGQYSYLIDLDNQQMFPTEVDGEWYEMNAGHRHVAANFGSKERIQLVVRILLKKNKLEDPVKIKIEYSGSRLEKARFIFDDEISPWLNYACKNSIIDNFKTDQKKIWFDIERAKLSDIKNRFSKNFNIEEV